MGKTLNVTNIDIDNTRLDGVDGINWYELRERARKEGADSALVWIDGDPIIVRFDNARK